MSADPKQPPLALRTYVASVVIVGAVPLGWALWSTLTQPHIGLILLAGMSVLSGPIAIRIPSLRATISVCEGFVFAAGLLFGPAAATLVAVIDGLAVSLWSRDRRLYRTLFNVTEPAISVSISILLFYRLAGVGPLLHHPVPFTPLIAPLVVLTISYFGLNTLLTAVAIRLESGTPPLRLLRDHSSHLILDFCVSLSLAGVMVQMSGNVTMAAVVLLVPMLLASYLSSHYAAGRLEDANRHISELRRLHDSAIETLALAIDAKDQVTHGHIRRVQALSTRLALVMDADQDEIRAIEAAALLHDLGKLAIPEHILNKPGPLTNAEFDQMKTHSGIGATILGSIHFPYPVAPIVRHHHENWDGSGYPDGLRGDAIPLGARILAVVDCYDALTSDRPYRRRMSDADAVAIIVSRSGQMYDPAVVDAFLAVYHAVPPEMAVVDTLENEAIESLRLARSPRAIRSREATTTRQRAFADRRQEVHETLRRLQTPDLNELAAVATQMVGASMVNSVVALYWYDESTDALVLCAADSMEPPVAPQRVKPGHGVTGWVAASRQSTANADAALDLGDEAGSEVVPPLRLCASAPIPGQGGIAGVLTVYSPYAFSEIDRMFIDVLAAELGTMLHAAVRRTSERRLPAHLIGIGSSRVN